MNDKQGNQINTQMEMGTFIRIGRTLVDTPGGQVITLTEVFLPGRILAAINILLGAGAFITICALVQRVMCLFHKHCACGVCG